MSLRVSRLAVSLLPVLLACGLLAGCGSKKSSERPYRMGELVITNSLRYTIFDSEWRDQIGEPPAQHVPKNRFLIIRLAVTNSGGSSIEVPTMQLENTAGVAVPELGESVGATDWLGVIRRLKPADTLQGTVVFDVPVGAYRLRVGSGTDITDDRTAVIDIPVQYTAPLEVPTPGTAPTPAK